MLARRRPGREATRSRRGSGTVLLVPVRPPSRTEFSTSDSSPSVWPSVIISACCGVTSRVAVVGIGGVSALAASFSFGMTGPSRWSSASTRMFFITVSLALMSRSAVDEVAGDRIGQDQVDAVAGDDEAADAGHLGDRNGDGALALGQHRGEEAAVAGLHDRRAGDRHALRQHLAGNAARQELPGPPRPQRSSVR